MIDKWIAEATECDFKIALEAKKLLVIRLPHDKSSRNRAD